MDTRIYMQGRVVSICSCNSFIIVLDVDDIDGFSSKRETIVIADIPRIAIWRPRGFMLKRMLSSTLLNRKIGLNIYKRDEHGNLCVDSTGFSAYMEASDDK